MNTSTKSDQTSAWLGAVVAILAILTCASGARGGLIYGDDVGRAVTTRAARGSATVFYEHDSYDWTMLGTAVDLNYNRQVSVAIQGSWGQSARAETVHQSSFRPDRMNFMLSAGAWQAQSGLPAEAHTSIDTWFYATEPTPYWLILDGSRANLSLTLENGQDAGVLHKAPDGTWTSANGFLASGWYHVSFALDEVAGGVESGLGISGQIGIPAPGALTGLAIFGGFAAIRRRR